MTKRSGKKSREETPANEVLGEVAQGSSDTGRATSDAGGNIEIKPSAETSANANAGSLVLPDGGLVAMRKSGGLRFTSRTVTVFRDGRVMVNTQAGGLPSDAGSAPHSTRQMNDAELAQLYRALDRAALPELPQVSGRQNPDAYAYELAALLEGREYSAEVFDGSVPEQVAPLIQLLARFGSDN